MRPSNDFGGKRQGRYVLGDLLGRGGMAEVFSGSSMGDHGFQKPVAIKRLIPELASDHVFVERLISEAKLLVGMQHGNIVSVLDLARDGDDVFLVMDLVDGPSLRQLIKARGTRGLSLGVATYVVQHAAQGLEFAHMRPGGAIIHADISPSNLLLTTSGEVRVADFGIARREGLGHGVVEGKWAYMAPEQARGEALTPSSDVFALGVVLYELITGQHPFGRQVTADEREAEAMRVIPPRVVKPSIPVGIDAICMRALAHEPRDRYGRMQAFMDALVDERFANGYREGAADLAAAIRECAVSGPAVGAPRTMVTDRPVTIVTRSLISQPRRGSAPVIEPATATPVPSVSGRITNPAVMLASVAEVAPMAASQVAHVSVHARGSAPVLPEMSPLVAPMPAFVLSQATTPEELGSVHGGHTASVHVASMAAPRTLPRWSFALLGVAALIGVGAAIAIQLAPSGDDEQPVVASTKSKDERIRPIDEHPSEFAATLDPEPVAPPIVPVVPVPPPVEVKPAEVETKPVEAKPAEKPIEAKPVGEAKPRTHTQRVAVAPHESHEAAPPLVPTGRHLPIVTVSMVEIWGWVQIDGGPKKEATFTHEPVSPGKHTLRITVGDEKLDIAPMICRITVPSDVTRMNIKVDLLNRKASGADACGR